MLHVLMSAIETTDVSTGVALLRAGQLAGAAATIVASARLLRTFGFARLVGLSRRSTIGAAVLAAVGTMGMTNGAETAVDRRVAMLLSTGGHDAVLAELPALPNDHLRRAYLVELLGQTTLNQDALRRVLSVASVEIGSDHELARLIVAMGEKSAFDGAAVAAAARHPAIP